MTSYRLRFEIRALDLRYWIGIPLLVTATVAAVPLCHGYAFGPPDGRAGDPPNGTTCVECHTSFPLNSGDGDLRLLNAPATVTPGETYDLMVELLDPGQSRWGFELTVLNEAAASGGQLIVTDPTRTQLSHDALQNRDYLKHTFAGTDALTPGPTRWSFQWAAPQIFSTITFYLAGNASDNSGFFLGDYIYSRTVTLQQTSPVAATTWGQIRGLFGGLD